MKTRFFAFYTLSAFAALSIGVLAATSGGTKQLPLRVSADENYRLELLPNKNILPTGSGSSAVVTLNTGNQIALNYGSYWHNSEYAWGMLYDGGYFENTTGIGGKISGLTSIEYNIAGKLKIEYGFDNYDKPYYYSAILADGTVRGTFSFDATVGYPDRFKIISEGNTTIGDISFNYSCTESIAHEHVDTDVIGRTGSTGSYVYKHICDICGEAKGSVVDLSGYEVTLGGNVYNPYNFDTYADPSRVGTLDFDYNETIEPGYKRFVLTISDDYTGKDLAINSNHTNPSQIYIKAENNAKVHDITFIGGSGVLLFVGDKLTFVQGNLTTEAKITSIKGPLSFEDTRKTKDAITVSNGQIYFENNVSITGYDVGIRMGRSLTGTKDLYQTGGTIEISNCDIAVASNTGVYQQGEYKATINIRSMFKINTSRVGFLNCNLKVGNDSASGTLLVDIDSAKAGSGRASGMQIDNTYTIDFAKGKAAFYATNGNANTSAIKITNGWSNGILTVAASGFEYGFANLDRGFDGEPTAVYGNDYSNTNESTFFYCFDAGAFDLAGYCGTKPSGTQLSGTDFNTKFGIQ